MPSLSVFTAVTFEKVHLRQRLDAMLFTELKQAQAKGYSTQTSTNNVHLLA